MHAQNGSHFVFWMPAINFLTTNFTIWFHSLSLFFSVKIKSCTNLFSFWTEQKIQCSFVVCKFIDLNNLQRKHSSNNNNREKEISPIVMLGIGLQWQQLKMQKCHLASLNQCFTAKTILSDSQNLWDALM